MRILSFFVIFSLLLITSHVASAQTAAPGAAYRTNLLVTEGKKSKEVKSNIKFGESSVTIAPEKAGTGPSKEFNYSDISGADYSFSKKPLLSTGGAIATAVLIGVLVLPLLFMKKKQHWMTIKGKEDFAVMRMEKENFRQLKSELEVRNIVVTTIDEDAKSKDAKDSKDKKNEEK